MRKIVQLIAVLAMLWASFELAKWALSYKQVEEDLQEAQKQEFVEFKNNFPNTVGWLELSGTRIDNPVLQTTDNNFYLTHNYKGEESRGGSIYMDYRNSPDLTDPHMILYGHVLRNETMFGSLAKFADEVYAKEHATFSYYNGVSEWELQVFAAYETTTEFYYIETEFEGNAFSDFIEKIRAKSLISMDVDVTEKDQIITLSTCTTSINDSERFVVHAKVVKK